MKFIRGLLVAAALVCLPSAVYAQAASNATPVQQTSTRNDAAVLVVSGSGTAQQTLTLTCGASLYAYLVTFEVTACQTTAAAATLITHTTTNLNGMKWYNIVGTANTCPANNFYPAEPLKAAVSGPAATIVTHAAVTNVTYNAVATYYCAQ